MACYKTIFTVIVEDLWVDKRYFGVNYTVLKGSDILDKGSYENSHDWGNLLEWKQILMSGEAATLALSRL